MEVRPFDQNDFFMPNGLTLTNARRIKTLFGNDTELRMHQQLNLYPGLDIIIKRKVNNNDRSDNQTNMLDNQTVEEVLFNKKTFSFFKFLFIFFSISDNR